MWTISGNGFLVRKNKEKKKIKKKERGTENDEKRYESLMFGTDRGEQRNPS